MRLYVRPHGGFELQRIGQASNLTTIEAMGVRVTITEGRIGRPDVLYIRLDPTDIVGALDVDEFAVTELQARIVVGSKGIDF